MEVGRHPRPVVRRAKTVWGGRGEELVTDRFPELASAARKAFQTAR